MRFTLARAHFTMVVEMAKSKLTQQNINKWLEKHIRILASNNWLGNSKRRILSFVCFEEIHITSREMKNYMHRFTSCQIKRISNCKKTNEHVDFCTLCMRVVGMTAIAWATECTKHIQSVVLLFLFVIRSKRVCENRNHCHVKCHDINSLAIILWTLTIHFELHEKMTQWQICAFNSLIETSKLWMRVKLK